MRPNALRLVAGDAQDFTPPMACLVRLCGIGIRRCSGHARGKDGLILRSLTTRLPEGFRSFGEFGRFERRKFSGALGIGLSR